MVTRLAFRGVTALAAAVAVLYAGALVLMAVIFAREASKWDEVRVFATGDAGGAESSSTLLDIYAQPPLNVARWLGISATIAVAYAIVVWGLWLIERVLGGAYGHEASGREESGRRWRRPARNAAGVFAWGIVALSAYSLGIFLWDWIEWRDVLNGGLTFPNDPEPESSPAFDSSQIPLGVVAFAAIAALPIVARALLRRRGRL